VPIEVVWSPLARARLKEIRAYIALDNPSAAERVAGRIVALVELLRRHPFLGRAGTEANSRELVVGGTPYLIFYKVSATRITIRTIWHGAQNRPGSGKRK